MAEVLAAKGYHYQFVFARNAGHTDRNVKHQTLLQLKAAEVECLPAGFGTVLTPELDQKRRRQQTLEALDEGPD